MLKELGNMLFPFTKDGQHGRFFSGKAQLSLNSDIVVIETVIIYALYQSC
ncbi:putative conjugative transfer protein TraC [Orientia tsutsugamushi str. Gilliam]|uniref:Putative conjugative transfer protein TraC n=1 Tax=Orientia tsutsugamushi str. Gilliam TaxID=1359184 RepID=A0A0F3M7S2_ORITS|nr:putative conjugative transfer protein TraC [Orientia tsutsugamushi str. Gilliam]